MLKVFYDLVPTELRCFGLSFSYGTIGVGDFFSGILVSAIDKAASHEGSESFFLNK